MALSSPVKSLVICVIILCHVLSSFQQCPNNIVVPAVKEGQGSKDHVLYRLSSVTSVTVTNNDGPYLAVNTTQSNGTTAAVLYIAKEIDVEELRKYEIRGRVSCADGGTPYNYGVIVPVIPVNEFAPEFIDPPYNQTVPENSQRGTSVFSFANQAEDPDYTEPPVGLSFGIVDNTSPFIIEDSETVIVNGSLDFDNGQRVYILNISAEERVPNGLINYTTLTITLSDTDDLGPAFSPTSTFDLVFPEGDYSGVVFNTHPTLTAKDRDTLNDSVQLELDQTSQSLADKFTVLDNGSINVTGTFSPGQFTFNVRAFQTNRPSDRFAIASVLVTVYDINNHDPVMSSAVYSGSVLESSPPGTVVLTVSASDMDQGDNSSFQFQLNDTSVPFNISTDRTIGILRVKEPLDRETVQSYTLYVYAHEDKSAEGRSSNISVVTVTVLDVNDNTPVFVRTSYNFTLNETDTAGSFVGQVNATDADEGDNGKVVYRIANTANTAFTVNSLTGIISLKRNLTQNDRGLVSFNVRANNEDIAGNVQRYASTLVKVNILAVNKYPPEFMNEPYNFTVPETAQVGLSLGDIQATDRDSDALSYSLVNAGNDFRLQGNPPSLLVNSSLDLDHSAAAEHRFTVVVRDGTFEISASVIVSVTMVNEYPPIMGELIYTVNVSENITHDSEVVQISATDADGGVDGRITFSITSTDVGPFVLNSTTGVLRCSGSLDFNVRQHYTLVVKATDGGNPPKSAISTIFINVIDINNKTPKFTGALTGSVSENVQRGTTVLQLQAEDEDTPSADLSYTLENVDPAGWVSLNGSFVITNSPLDAESAHFITASVTVSDGVNSISRVLNISVLDVNDNSPQIILKDSTVDIPENATMGTTVTTVEATDRDVTQSGKFLFFLGSSPSGKFAINSSSGEITVAASFDRRIQTEYDVMISVSDNSAPPQINSAILHVVITDSNTAPQFVDSHNSSTTSYSFNISESLHVGKIVGQVKALDQDSGSSGQVHYTIESGNDEDMFQLDAGTGRLVLLKNLDYEHTRLYSLVINATDNSFEPKWTTATVTVTVYDIIEAPQWPERLPIVPLTTNDPCADVQLGARPRDILQTSSSSQSEVVYSLLNYTQIFSINNETGLLQSKGDLSVGTYSIGLRACSALDTTKCSDAVLTVQVSAGDIITFCPPFLTVNVNESDMAGHEVVDVNTTKGDRNITYTLKNTATPFSLNSTTGVLTVHSQLDREKQSHYTLLIEATYLPSGGTATAQVTVVIDDAADSAPRFLSTQYEGEITEAAYVGSPVLLLGTNRPLIVSANDADLNPQLTFSILLSEDDSNGSFSVNSTTGEIILHKAVDLEKMTADLNGQYHFTVMVSDGYSNDNTTVTVKIINVNDNSPIFDPDVIVFNVSEAIVPPYNVGTLKATDLDPEDSENLRYTLVSTDSGLPFFLTSSGVLQLTKQLDRETVPFYSFTVAATDPEGRNGTAMVNISVGDANDPPQFHNATYTFHVTEGPEGVGSQLMVSASENDTGNLAILTYSILSGNDGNYFNITTFANSTGMIQVVKELDRETTASLTLTVTATDSGVPPLTATCTVQVMVADINDNSPVFSSADYKAVVSEGAPNNTQLHLVPTLSVTDDDARRWGKQGIVYSLENVFPSVPFRVNPQNGNLFVSLFSSTEGLDREITPTYTLTLVATDDYGNGLNGTTKVTVSLTNVNDHSPEFLQSHYDFTVPENATVTYIITTFNATDSDSDPSLLKFFIYPPDGQGKFSLNFLTGELHVSGPLDRETQDHYILHVGVSDGLFIGNATVNITVEDVNDNCPVFNNNQPLSLKVMENETPQVIYVFNVTDNDLGSSADVSFFMNDSAVANRYLSLSLDGNLSTTQSLDREKDDQQTFTFTVWARDDGSPPCSSSLSVQLDVLGANEEVPVVCHITRQQQPLCNRSISVSVFNGSLEGTFLAALTWRDADVGEGGEATLTLSNNPDSLLFLNQTSPTTSILTLAKNLSLGDLIAKGLLLDDNATYTAVVTATDEGQQSKSSSVDFFLTIKELLPTAPIFSSSVYRFSVLENQAPEVIGSVTATAQTPGLQINYTVQATSDFGINRWGNISTLQELDRETTDMYTFLVLAWDSSGSSETATSAVLVTVLDENDNVPKFTAPVYNVTVSENISDVELLTLVASDNDAGKNGIITFTLLNNSLSNIFLLNSTSGVLWLNQPLNHEEQSSYTLFVQAADGGTPPQVSQTIVQVTVQDINDNAPSFTQEVYTGYVDEKSPPGTWVLNVSATDLDMGLNGQVLYNFLRTDPLGSDTVPFFINEFSGAIYTSRTLSYQTEQNFNLTVVARDVGTRSLTSTAKVTIWINDLSVVLPQLVFDPERVVLVLGTFAGTVLPLNVSGGFGNYNFSIIGGNENGIFFMDKDSGKITVTKKLTTTTTYQLTIRVINLDDTKYLTDGTLNIVVTSLSLGQEQYAAVLPESITVPYLLLDINSNAESAGIAVTYQLRGDGIEGIFRIEETTGKVWCEKKLDREDKSEYIMNVFVQLPGNPATGRKKRALGNEAVIRVIVGDINDNPPKFDLMTYIFGIPSSAPAYTLVTTLQALDPDSGQNGLIRYEATGGDLDVFSVTPEGKVMSLVPMTSKSEGEQFKLVVNATDNNGICGMDTVCQSTGTEIKIVVVANSDRFGLVANFTVTHFVNNQQMYLRNLSEILNMTLQLDKVEPHGNKVIDTSKSNIYFFAFDNSGRPIPFETVNKKVQENAAAINALLSLKGDIQVIPVTEPPIPVRVETRYRMGDAEIAVLVVACLIFVVSLIAIILSVRAWRKQKELQKREEAAARARQGLEKETRNLAGKLQETSFVADPEEPLELDMDPEDEGRVFNPRMFLKNMRESEHRPFTSRETEDQGFVINFGNESNGLDTVTLRQTVLNRAPPNVLEALAEDEDDHPEHTEVDSGTENNNGSVSSEEHQQNNMTSRQEESPQLGGSNKKEPEVHSSSSDSSHNDESLADENVSTQGRDGSTSDYDSRAETGTSCHEISDMEGSMRDDEESLPSDAALNTKLNDQNMALSAADDQSTEDASPLSSTENEDYRLEDPEPDYQKRVSFAEVLDVKENNPDKADDGQQQVNHADSHHERPVTSDHNYLAAASKLLETLRANKSEGVVNPLFNGDDVLDGWADDYERQSRSSNSMSTAL